MIPQFTLIVYKVVTHQRILQGKTTIVTQNLSENYVSLYAILGEGGGEEILTVVRGMSSHPLEFLAAHLV